MQCNKRIIPNEQNVQNKTKIRQINSEIRLTNYWYYKNNFPNN